MDPFKGQGGIQMLLTAEQEAQHIVSNARNLRTQRLNQAKEEAEIEAAQYRSHMEDDYQKSLSETSGSSGSNVKRLDEETEAKINNLKESASKVSTEVVDMLLNDLYEEENIRRLSSTIKETKLEGFIVISCS